MMVFGREVESGMVVRFVEEGLVGVVEVRELEGSRFVVEGESLDCGCGCLVEVEVDGEGVFELVPVPV